MSLITSCPACGTMFRVVPDQLKISEGWVRCGHCSQVFDATAHLGDEGDAGTQRAMQRSAADPATVDTQPGEQIPPPAERFRQPTADSALPHDADEAAEQEIPLEPSPLDTPFVLRRSDLVQGLDSSILPPEPSGGYAAEDSQVDEELHEVSFVRDGRRKAFWRRPMVRVGLAFVSLLLALLLALQIAWQDHDRLAQLQPELRPALERMCELLQCTIDAPRQIDAIVIESSGFNRVRNDTYRLGFTLRNTARVQVAPPAIELTITDSQDQPIARRVLMPAELAADRPLPAAGDWSGSVGVVLSVPATTRVAGYRLLAFYP